jgi:hypothetical protein
MRVQVRFALLALLVGALVAVSASVAQASVEIEKFVGVNCAEGFEHCGEKSTGKTDAFGTPLDETVEPSPEESEEQGYRQAGGHVPFGVTDFTVKHSGSYSAGTAIPNQVVTHVRVDVAAGLATSPAAVPQCTMAEFTGSEVGPFFTAPSCKTGGGPHGTGPESTVIGEESATVYVAGVGDVVLKGTLYNLVQPEPPAKARASYFGAALALPKPLTESLTGGFTGQLYAHTIVEGNVEWAKEAKGTNAGDYHDYFEVTVAPTLPLIRSRQLDYGQAGNGAFITNATSCPGDNTTQLSLEGVANGTKEEVEERLAAGTREEGKEPYTTLFGLDNCGLPPFNPTFTLGSSSSTSDAPDGITTEVALPHFPEEEVDSSQLKTATIKLPEGMTLNPSAAAGLTACTPAQAHIHELPAGVGCAESSKLGTVELEVPTLPAGSLKGNVYLGGPEGGGAITKPPYTIYVDAESARYGVSVRLKGEVVPNEATGQLTTTFNENPEQPFTSIKLQFNSGNLAPIANPLSCTTGNVEGVFSPVTLTADKTSKSSFTTTGCASTIPFAPVQGTSDQTSNAGAATSFTVSLTRPEGNQYLSHVSTTLPPGLVGRIPTVPLCPAAQAAAGTCEAASAIGSANVLSGAGVTPFALSGTAYLTGPYNGAPYGIDVQVPVVAGPFNLGSALTRLGIYVNQTTGQVTAAGYLPSIVYGGVPTRLRQVSINVNRQGFMTNPTNCGTLATESTLTGSLGASATVSTPFQVGNCNALAFKPTFKAVTGAKTSKANGASLETTINAPAGQANFKSVTVQLPKQLPSRLTTLQKACPEATFAANPSNCPSGSFVGGVRANTPVLPDKMKGPAILVSHGGQAFPDLDLILEADGVRVILVGNTNIKNGITTTKFAATPDVPVSSITVNLPIGSHSAVTAFGNVCAQPLIMPTTMVAQNGLTIKQNTRISVPGCGVRIVGHKVIGNIAYLTVATPASGRISGSGSSVATVYRHLGSAVKATTLKIPLSRGGQRRGRPFHVKLRVGYVPTQRSRGSSAASVTVTFR